MPEMGRKFDQDFRESAVRLVRETGKPIGQVTRHLGINEGSLGNWVNADKRRRGDGTGVLDEVERAEMARLRKENAELAMERGCAQTLCTRQVNPHPPRPGHQPPGTPGQAGKTASPSATERSIWRGASSHVRQATDVQNGGSGW